MTVSKLPKYVIDKVMSEYKKPEGLLGENGGLKKMTKARVERALETDI
ncbi:hypothetical protein [Mariprofundus ferrooxydans]|nr:hypothetical protein [Mariprofundus ferrooxydans]